MRRRTLLAVTGILLILPAAGVAQFVMPYSVVGSGGGEMTGTSLVMNGTVGQAAIGVVSGPNNINQIGFWYRPGWILTGVEDSGDLYPNSFWLGQNHPNPFNPVTTIQFGLPKSAHVTMKLYDASGREVMTLIDGQVDAGFHDTVVDGSSLASGVYFCRMVSERFVEARKLVLLK